MPEWRVIAVLARTPGLSAAEVAARTAMDKVAVSRAVAGLARSGRVRRTQAARDRRRSVLTLTTRGRSVYRRIVPLALAYERRLLESVVRRRTGASSASCWRGCSTAPGVSDRRGTRVYNPRRHATRRFQAG